MQLQPVELSILNHAHMLSDFSLLLEFSNEFFLRPMPEMAMGVPVAPNLAVQASVGSLELLPTSLIAKPTTEELFVKF